MTVEGWQGPGLLRPYPASRRTELNPPGKRPVMGSNDRGLMAHGEVSNWIKLHWQNRSLVHGSGPGRSLWFSVCCIKLKKVDSMLDTGSTQEKEYRVDNGAVGVGSGGGGWRTPKSATSSTSVSPSSPSHFSQLALDLLGILKMQVSFTPFSDTYCLWWYPTQESKHMEQCVGTNRNVVPFE